MTPLDLRSAFEAYAVLFGYPTAGCLDGAARRARALVTGRAASALERFGAWLATSSPASREEEYTAALDLSPSCPPYLGYHLVGDGQPRGAFLARLAGVMQAHAFEPGGELADHVGVVLRFLAAAPEGPDRRALLADALVPALDRMRAAFEGRPSPYRDLVESLGAFASDAALAGAGAEEVTA